MVVSTRGSVYVTHANVGSIVPVECLTGGHSATVRCAHWEHQVSLCHPVNCLDVRLSCRVTL